MTTVYMTSKWSEVKPQGFYVYLHRRASDGSIFYVGKGSNKRAWNRSGRSQYWIRVARKNGVVIDICQDAMKEDDAFLLEEWIIAGLLHSGAVLTNMSSGGEGASGCGKVVYTSCGMSFKTSSIAVSWLHNNGYPSATANKISDVCRGVSMSAYSRCWSYSAHTVGEYVNRSDLMKRLSRSAKMVYCSNGMSFYSIRAAADWVRCNINESARHTPISYCISGRQKTAYGFTWSLSKDKLTEYISPELSRSISMGVPVSCSNGMVFHSGGAAAKWLKEQGLVKASDANIMKCCKGDIRSAYGYSWRYA